MKKGERKALLAAHQARVRQGLGNRTGFPTSKGAVTERFFREQAALADWGVTKRGWPDFILQRDGNIVFVEAKSEPETQEQQVIAEALAEAGFIVFRWDPIAGFQQVGGTGAVHPW